MTKRRKRYTKEEKLEIVHLSLKKENSIKSLAERFGISSNVIYNWRSIYYKFDMDAFPGKGNKLMSKTEREMSDIKKELRESKLEIEILKKAISIFSKDDRKF